MDEGWAELHLINCNPTNGLSTPREQQRLVSLFFLFPHTMIKSVLIFNNHGKPRLIKFYQQIVSSWRSAADMWH